MKTLLEKLKPFCKKNRTALIIIVTSLILVILAVSLTVALVPRNKDALPSVVSLEIVSPPTQTEYLENSLFDTSGLVIKANYDNGEQIIVSEWDYDKKQPLTVSDTKVTISYSGKTISIDIVVKPKILKAIMASSLPNKVCYSEGEYFDFYGLEIYAIYENDVIELVKGWDYDKKELLQITDESVVISYTVNDVTKTFVVAITVNAKIEKTPEEKLIQEVLAILPPVDELAEDNLSSIDYAISLLEGVSVLTSEQLELQEALVSKRKEITDNMPPLPEEVYTITYGIANDLSFGDIDYGDNPVKYKNSEGQIVLNDAISESATMQGYEFVGWLRDGQSLTSIENLSANVNVYALFELTATTDIVFKEIGGSELLRLQGIFRTGSYEFRSNNISGLIYSENGTLPVAFYSTNNIRISAVDLSAGKENIVNVVTAKARELHMSNGDSATVGWTYSFMVNSELEQTDEIPSVGTVFTVPIGASVTIISTNANIDDIIVEGESRGVKVNNSIVQAVFEMSSGEYAISVTFKTIISSMTTISFIGYNSHSIVYPENWNGYIADVDLGTVEFIYDESSMFYLNTYTIDGTEYYFDDLSRYQFSRDTQVWVNRVRNSFSLTLIYKNGNEKFENLVGKQTLQAALNSDDMTVFDKLNTILSEGRLYEDSEMTIEILREDLLLKTLRRNITIYSDWECPEPLIPTFPVFEKVDYSGMNFVNTWTSLFMYEGDILSSEIILVADGSYSYRTMINGNISVNLNGIYRIEAERVVIKTLNSDIERQLVEESDFSLDIRFVQDGILCASFIDLRGAIKTVFNHTLLCGNVRPVNYTGEDFIDVYEMGGVLIELRENGTAVISHSGVESSVYYRVTENGHVYIFDNNSFGTGEIIGLFGE